jgi:hypothetical protein
MNGCQTVPCASPQAQAELYLTTIEDILSIQSGSMLLKTRNSGRCLRVFLACLDRAAGQAGTTAALPQISFDGANPDSFSPDPTALP